MGLDIRWPIGWMFSIIGLMLVIYGAATGSRSELYERSLNMNVNLWWGLLLLIFGAGMLFFAWRDKKRGDTGAK